MLGTAERYDHLVETFTPPRPRVNEERNGIARGARRIIR